MTCARCGTTNRRDAKFCVECGSSLAATCPGCGTVLDAGAKFCPECGTRVAAGSTSGTAPASSGAAGAFSTAATPVAAFTPEPATERRLVSVLFADLVGFTSLSEGRDAEAVRDLLNLYFERSSEIVTRYGGTVEKFIGDAVMAVWGTPVAHEDDAERAVRAALDIVEAVRDIGREQATDALQGRAAVLTGETAVTLGALNQGMVAGDLVNTASRLQSVAEPGTVLVGEATRLAAAEAIAFEAVGEQLLKGKTTPVPAFRALRVVGTRGGAIRAESLEPPFVGREAEFRLLRELFHATARERRARLVSLTGQAGIGKSRLAWEFQKYLDGLRQVIWWHQGRSPSYGDGVTFWALGEMVRKRARLVEGDDEATSRQRIAEAVAEHVPDPDERAFVEPALLALLGLDEPPPGGRDRLFAGWRMFLERLSDSSNVVLVFEDLHWADDGMLDFIDHLLEWSRSYPILVVTLARPELLDRRPTWGATRSASSLALSPLGDAEMRTLLAGLVPGLPEPAVRSVLGRADGIPLYAVETVRMLVADGRLEPDGEGHFRPTSRLDAVEVPATLQALIAARLDGLDPADRALLQDASVLGQTFTVESLAAITGIAVDGLVPRLRALVARELLALDTDPASPERGQYGFVQALIREVAYSTLAKRDRRTRHLAAARHFEAMGEEELAPVLASHYLDAYRAAPEGAEGEAVRAQARIALRAAADRAISLGSYGGAVTYLEQALELGSGEPAEAGELLAQAGRAADLDGQYDRSAGLLARAADAWREAGDADRTAAAIADEALAVMDAGRLDAALELLEAAQVEFGGPEHAEVRAPIVARIAHVAIRKGVGGRALEAADEVLPIAERRRMTELFLDTLITKAAALGQAGRDMEGSILVEGAMRRASELGFVPLAMRAMLNAVVQAIDSSPSRAFELGLETIEEARRYGFRSNIVLSAANTAEIAVHMGEWAKADEIIRSVLQLDLSGIDRALLLVSLMRLELIRGRPYDEIVEELERLEGPLGGAAAATMGDVEIAQAQLAGDHAAARSRALAVAASDDLNAPSMYEAACRAALWMGDLEAARADLHAFEALRRSAAFPVAQLAGVAAGVAALEGRRADAVDAYRDAARQFRELRLAFVGALHRLDAARLLGIETREGGAAADEARATFERLGAVPYLAILDGLASAAGMSTRATAASAATDARAEAATA